MTTPRRPSEDTASIDLPVFDAASFDDTTRKRAALDPRSAPPTDDDARAADREHERHLLQEIRRLRRALAERETELHVLRGRF